MEKMSLEEFRSIKIEIAEIANIALQYNESDEELSEEDAEKKEAEIEEKIKNMRDKIHSSDLSDIPFEEYEGFYDLGFDFSGTKANLDYGLIDISLRWYIEPIDLRGCKVRNFDFDHINYNEDSFDPEFIEQHPERFLSTDIPRDVRQRFYNGQLSTYDVLKNNIPYDDITKKRLSYDAQRILEIIDFSIIKEIDPEIFNLDLFGSYDFKKMVESIEGDVTNETLTNAIKNKIEELVSEGLQLNFEKYKKILSIPRIREYLSEDLIIDFGDDSELAEKFLRSNLKLNDIYRNREVFRGKRFLTRFDDYRYDMQYDQQRKYKDISEEKIMYFFDNFPDLSEGVTYYSILYRMIRSINPEASKEENEKTIASQAVEILNGDNAENLEPDTVRSLERYYSLEVVKSKLDEYDRSSFEKIMRYTTPEKIQSYEIPPRIFESNDVLLLFSRYGLETVMDFDRENGNVFSRNNFELAKNMHTYYFHYAGNTHDPRFTIYHKTQNVDDYDAPYTMEDFEECVRRMIVYGPSDGNYSHLQPIDFRDFSQHFKERYPRMFLPENVDQELQDKFYTRTLQITDFEEHSDWIDLLEGKDFKVGVKKYPYITFMDQNTYQYIPFEEAISRINSSEKEKIHFFLGDNSKTLQLISIFKQKTGDSFNISFLDKFHSLDELRREWESQVELYILSGELEYGEPYIPKFFKDKHPELVLDKDAPEELKKKYYSLHYKDGINVRTDETITLKDLVNDEYYQFLIGKSFDHIRNADNVKNITTVFDLKTIKELYGIDPSALEVYCQSLTNANVLKQALGTYPELYAKEEMMSGLGLSEEEFKSRLQDEEFRQQFETIKRGYYEDVVRNPGFILHLEPEQQSREMLNKYKQLSAQNMLQGSSSFSRDTYEQILGHMLGFLGFEEASKILAVPQIDEETLSRIYARDEKIKSLYEKKFEITGNLQVIKSLFEGIPGLLPTNEKITSKNCCKIFKSINDRITNGFNKDLSTLLREALAENNMAVDEERIEQLVNRVIKISSMQKLDQVREHNSVTIDNSINENQKTKNMIKIHYRNAIEYSLIKAERVDPGLVREYLSKEFERVGENGEPYYSGHVTSHLDELVSFSSELAANPEWNKILNHTVVDDLREESSKIGHGWIRKITSNLCYVDKKLTYEEAEILDNLIYPEDSGFEIDTLPCIGLKELTEEEKQKVYKLLNSDNYRGLFSYGIAESMFSALNPPYSEKFKDYFLKHKEEFLTNPEIYTKFTVLASKFDAYLEDSSINTRYIEGILTPNDLLLKLSTDVYKNLVIGKGEHEVVYQARSGGLSEEQAKIALRLFKDMKQREYQTIPQEQVETSRFRGRIVRMDDPLHFAVGEITNCCQTIGVGQPGETSMIHSAIERNGALFVVEEIDESGRPTRIVSQSWTWRNGNRVCFDNVEIPHTVEAQLKNVGGFDEIMSIYQNAGIRMIETDRKKLKKLLKSGKITEEEYRSMVIKDVTMGLGCDDLVKNLSGRKKSETCSVPTVYPLERGKTYTGANSRTLYTDASNAILISHNEDFSPEDHTHTNEQVGDHGVKYIKHRDIMRRKGFDIDSDKIETISDMSKKNGEHSSFEDEILISGVLRHFGVESLGMIDADRFGVNMSDTGDWYILYEETGDGVMILESGLDTTEPQTKLDKVDRMMALTEYTREMYKMMLDSSNKGKAMTIDHSSLGKYINLQSLIDEGLISIEDGVITVNSPEELKKCIEFQTQSLEQKRRERLLLPEDKDEINM